MKWITRENITEKLHMVLTQTNESVKFSCNFFLQPRPSATAILWVCFCCSTVSLSSACEGRGVMSHFWSLRGKRQHINATYNQVTRFCSSNGLKWNLKQDLHKQMLWQATLALGGILIIILFMKKPHLEKRTLGSDKIFLKVCFLIWWCMHWDNIQVVFNCNSIPVGL